MIVGSCKLLGPLDEGIKEQNLIGQFHASQEGNNFRVLKPRIVGGHSYFHLNFESNQTIEGLKFYPFFNNPSSENAQIN